MPLSVSETKCNGKSSNRVVLGSSSVDSKSIRARKEDTNFDRFDQRRVATLVGSRQRLSSPFNVRISPVAQRIRTFEITSSTDQYFLQRCFTIFRRALVVSFPRFDSVSSLRLRSILPRIILNNRYSIRSPSTTLRARSST